MNSFALKDYSQVIVDGSYFINRFPEPLALELVGREYYTSSNYKSECTGYLMHMTQEQRQVFTDNYKALEKATARTLEASTDLWHDLCRASGSGRAILVITSNLLLIEKIVLRGLKLDIYNLHELAFMPQSMFERYRQFYTCKQDPGAVPEKLFDPKASDLDVYDETLWIRTLQKDSEFTEGKEAYLYRDPDAPELLAKLFTPSHRSSEKLTHVKALLELNRDQMRCTWAAMPEQMLYLRPGSTPLGFLMPRHSGLRNLDEGISVEHTMEKKVCTILDWCIMLATQAAYLAVFGIYITDFSGCNFLLPADDAKDRHIIMIDTDSFCLNTYFGGRFDSEISTWSILDVTSEPETTKADLIDMSTRLLFAKVFYIITAGHLPYNFDDNYVHDPIDGSIDEDGWVRYLFPGRLLELIDRVLGDTETADNVPSLDGMIHILLQTQEQLNKESPDLTYEQLYRQYMEEQPWSINGLHEEPAPEPEPEPESPAQETVQAPPPEQSGSRRTKAKKSTKSRTVNKNDPFVSPRLTGAVLEPEPADVLHKMPKVRISRREVSEWKREQQLDQEKARWISPHLYRAAFLALILFTVWLCIFADFEVLQQIRQTAIDWADRAVYYWTEDNLPLVDDFWERIRSLLPQLRRSA